jgi:hypothetical protein
MLRQRELRNVHHPLAERAQLRACALRGDDVVRARMRDCVRNRTVKCFRCAI